MLDKVLKAWECCNPFNRRCAECPYEDICFHDNFNRVAVTDMVILLKEHKAEVVELLEEQRGLYKEIERLRNELPKKGHWVKTTVRGSSAFGCSVCGCESGTLYDYAFCPNCGADMRGEQE